MNYLEQDRHQSIRDAAMTVLEPEKNFTRRRDMGAGG
jgi:hypothetical protein